MNVMISHELKFSLRELLKKVTSRYNIAALFGKSEERKPTDAPKDPTPQITFQPQA